MDVRTVVEVARGAWMKSHNSLGNRLQGSTSTRVLGNCDWFLLAWMVEYYLILIFLYASGWWSHNTLWCVLCLLHRRHSIVSFDCQTDLIFHHESVVLFLLSDCIHLWIDSVDLYCSKTLRLKRFCYFLCWISLSCDCHCIDSDCLCCLFESFCYSLCCYYVLVADDKSLCLTWCILPTWRTTQWLSLVSFVLVSEHMGLYEAPWLLLQ